MPRGRRASSAATAEDIQRELEQLKQRQSELRGLLRKSRAGGMEVRMLEKKPSSLRGRSGRSARSGRSSRIGMTWGL